MGNLKMRVKKVKVFIEKEIEIDLSNTFGPLTEKQFLEEWRSSLWEIDGIEDVYKHAAIMAATGCGGVSLDGLGRLESHGECDTRFKIIDEDAAAEIINW